MNVAQKVPFQGDDYDRARDAGRLGAQLQRVYDVMKDGRWRSTEEIVIELMRGGRPREKGESIARQVRYLKDIPGCLLLPRYEGNGLYRHSLSTPEDQGRLAI